MTRIRLQDGLDRLDPLHLVLKGSMHPHKHSETIIHCIEQQPVNHSAHLRTHILEKGDKLSAPANIAWYNVGPSQ